MSKVLANGSTKHEQALMLQMCIGVNVITKNVKGGIDERDGQVKQSSGSIVFIGDGGGTRDRRHPGQGMVKRSLLVRIRQIAPHDE